MPRLEMNAEGYGRRTWQQTRKRSGLAFEALDEMTIIDLARVPLAVATEHADARPAFDVQGLLAHGYAMADEQARNGVLRASEGEDPVLAHARGEFIELSVSARRQRPQQRAFDSQALLHPCVHALHNGFHERLVRYTIVEIARAT